MSLLEPLYPYLWPLPPKKLRRTLPLRVLALGLPRTGTNSLVVALQKVGFKKPYHGFDHVDDPRECRNWLSLWSRKQAGDLLTAADLDGVLGDCDALTDSPAVLFAEVLVRAYPDAKVVVNYRQDQEAWYRSVVQTWSKAGEQSGPPWLFNLSSLFSARMFWLQLHERRVTHAGLFRGSYRKFAKAVYEDHYDLLERITEGRSTLKWKAQDGWEPLCEFLGEPVPSEEFPKTNSLDEVLARVVKSATTDAKSAMARLGALVAILIGVVLWCCSRLI